MLVYGVITVGPGDTEINSPTPRYLSLQLGVSPHDLQTTWCVMYVTRGLLFQRW